MKNTGNILEVPEIKGSPVEVAKVYLKIYLAQERLPETQIDVLAQLAVRYSKYMLDGLKEPYASVFLFSTDTRKDICKSLDMQDAHLNNTLRNLAKVQVLGKEGGKYLMNPHLVPAKGLNFRFQLDA